MFLSHLFCPFPFHLVFFCISLKRVFLSPLTSIHDLLSCVFSCNNCMPSRSRDLTLPYLSHLHFSSSYPTTQYSLWLTYISPSTFSPIKACCYNQASFHSILTSCLAAHTCLLRKLFCHTFTQVFAQPYVGPNKSFFFL